MALFVPRTDVWEVGPRAVQIQPDGIRGELNISQAGHWVGYRWPGIASTITAYSSVLMHVMPLSALIAMSSIRPLKAAR